MTGQVSGFSELKLALLNQPSLNLGWTQVGHFPNPVAMKNGNRLGSLQVLVGLNLPQPHEPVVLGWVEVRDVLS